MIPRLPALRFKIAGRWWRWVYRRMRDDWGVCDYATRTISINSRHTSGRELLDTEIHEALHGLQAFASEDHTAEVASTLTDILWGLGYRRTEAARDRVYTGD